PGWVEALSMMKAGDRWLVHIPSALAYGPRGYAPIIPPNSDLEFEVELVDVLSVN
ncbi:MAG: peptidylprolyl isomerase, partial [Alphaproteobacteria bacterium]|nr:peptidylprolyl isomerase [Alphaproteobacteria bacterium]